MASAELQIVRARTNLILQQPFFGALALRLKCIEDNTQETAYTDGRVIGYNADFVNKLSISKIIGLIAHEVMHPAFLHHVRRGARKPGKWNIACDYAINNILVKAGFDLPEKGCIDPKYDNMSAEEIYSLLPDDFDGPGANPDPGGCGAVRDGPATTASQIMEEEAEWKTALAQAAHVAKQQGKLPAGIDRMMEDLFEPQIPWRAVLQRFATEKAPDEITWSRCNRRFIGAGIYLPTRSNPNIMDSFVGVIDTSGSIGDKELREFMSEFEGIRNQMRPTTTYLMYCDAAVAAVDEFGPDDPLTVNPKGGGGTDFRPPFEWLAERGITPSVLVYLTDGYGSFPDQEADFPVMWCINNRHVVPPHGEHLVLEV